METRRALSLLDATFDDSELRLQKLYAERFELPEISIPSSSTLQAAKRRKREASKARSRDAQAQDDAASRSVRA